MRVREVKDVFINEIFYSIQGEGVRAGTANVFVRFSGCNMRCDLEANEKSPGGFMCDTEFQSGRRMTVGELVKGVADTGGACKNVIFTGGEPGLQLTEDLVGMMREHGFFMAVESNGTCALPAVDWICVSPKVAEHALKQPVAHELKYVRHYGQGIPKPIIKANHYLISPAASPEGIDQRTLEWCINLVKENPTWRLSVQQHKSWKVR
jgi:organic radical activating enzyme